MPRTPGTPPGSSTEAQARGARLPASKTALPGVLRAQQGAGRALKPPPAASQPPAPGRTPRGEQKEGEVGWQPQDTPRLPPSSRGPWETTPLPRGRAPAGPAPSRAGRPKCPRALAPCRQLPRGRGPRRAPRAPGAPRSPEAPARPLRSGEGARVPAGSPAAADSIRAGAAEGLAGGRVYQRETSRPRSPPTTPPPPPPPPPQPRARPPLREGTARGRRRGGERPGVGGRKARGDRRGEGRAGPQRKGERGRGEAPVPAPRSLSIPICEMGLGLRAHPQARTASDTSVLRAGKRGRTGRRGARPKGREDALGEAGGARSGDRVSWGAWKNR